uniref:Uncharacterized protein n=1 Tax=Lactuca sativa TaxID=4236 RepID=A0A9R1VY68_LACSA|nr:hypothetical protein LSAT_V11C400199660 [Lactuca sativa]
MIESLHSDSHLSVCSVALDFTRHALTPAIVDDIDSMSNAILAHNLAYVTAHAMTYLAAGSDCVQQFYKLEHVHFSLVESEAVLRAKVTVLSTTVGRLEEENKSLISEKLVLEDVLSVLEGQVGSLTQANESLEWDLDDHDRELEVLSVDRSWLLQVVLVRIVDNLLEHHEFAGGISRIRHDSFVVGEESGWANLKAQGYVTWVWMGSGHYARLMRVRRMWGCWVWVVQEQVTVLSTTVGRLEEENKSLISEKLVLEDVLSVLEGQVGSLTQANESLEWDLDDHDRELEVLSVDRSWLLQVVLVRIVDNLLEHHEFAGGISRIRHDSFVVGKSQGYVTWVWMGSGHYARLMRVRRMWGCWVWVVQEQVTVLSTTVGRLEEENKSLISEKLVLEDVLNVLEGQVGSLTQANESLEWDLDDHDRELEVLSVDRSWLLQVVLVRIVDNLLEHHEFAGGISRIRHDSFVVGEESGWANLKAQLATRGPVIRQPWMMLCWLSQQWTLLVCTGLRHLGVDGVRALCTFDEGEEDVGMLGVGGAGAGVGAGGVGGGDENGDGDGPVDGVVGYSLCGH